MPLPGAPWATERPGVIDEATRALLERMESGGAAHGQWRRQRASSIAEQIPEGRAVLPERRR